MKAIIETAGDGTYGPFRDEETASAWACAHVRGPTWRLVRLRDPTGIALDDLGLTTPFQREIAR